MQIGDSVDDDDAMFIRQIDAIKDINCAFIETRKGMKLIQMQRGFYKAI